MNETTNFLRNVLKANALFSFISGIIFAVFYKEVGVFIGIEPIASTLITGLILIIFALFVWYAATRDSLNPLLVWIIIDLDILWVIGTVYSILADSYSYAGNWIMGILSLVVLDFAIAQYIGHRKSKSVTKIKTVKN